MFDVGCLLGFRERAGVRANSPRSCFQSKRLIVVPTVFLLLLLSCQTPPPLAPIDLTEPGWTLRRGQAIWTPPQSENGIAGELIVAHHPDGRSFVQFIKTPIPMVNAQTDSSGWQIDFPTRPYERSGTGQPPARFIWLHLARCLEGDRPPGDWEWEFLLRWATGWSLRNPTTGESLKGYFSAE
jgi:hypothetical protein